MEAEGHLRSSVVRSKLCIHTTYVLFSLFFYVNFVKDTRYPKSTCTALRLYFMRFIRIQKNFFCGGFREFSMSYDSERNQDGNTVSELAVPTTLILTKKP